jgi:hypothetical protein
MKNICPLLISLTQLTNNWKIRAFETKCHAIWEMTLNNSEREKVALFGCNVRGVAIKYPD